MLKSLPIHDLEGRDDQASSYSKECNSDTTAAIPHGGRGRILLSLMNSDGTEYHAAIVLPTSYSVCPTYFKKGRATHFIVEWKEAKAMAVNVFHAQITDTRMEVTDLVLKLRMKLSTHKTTWALLRPEEWTDVVPDGDENRYVAKIPPAQWLTVIRELADENPSCEILVQKC